MIVDSLPTHHRDTLCEGVMAAAGAVHAALGKKAEKPAYARALCAELVAREIPFACDVWIAERYKALPLNCGHVVDFLVDGQLILNIEATPRRLEGCAKDLMAQTRLKGCTKGFWINFARFDTKEGIVRVGCGDGPQDA